MKSRTAMALFLMMQGLCINMVNAQDFSATDIVRKADEKLAILTQATPARDPGYIRRFAVMG
jgi:hypothetical protein